MKKVKFLFGIHNHQPVGNFDSIFEDSFARCYIPFLEVLEKHPGIRVSLHSSGPLWDFAKAKAPNYISLIQKLVDKNQIELLGGGYYEPLLSIIPKRDAIGQIQMMSAFIKKTFNKEVKGIWLTERVWEPHLPEIFAEAGVKYTIIDESHFRLAGIVQKHIKGYWLTEKYGKSLALFPISKQLRYNIPFRLPHETTDLLREIQNEEPSCITYADDGEKFGIWPETYKWVFEERWLHNFFDEIEKNLSWIEMPTFSEYLESSGPEGNIYLPTASYEEMMEWALPHESATRFKRISKEIEGMGKKEEYSAFLRGGIWNNFLAKYPESNQMYRRMLHVSNRLEATAKANPDSRELTKAKEALYRAQCNCSYWHGLFGGLYLNYLRHAIYSNLIDAEKHIDKVEHSGHKFWCEVFRKNFTDKREEEMIVETRDANIVISPSLSASLMEFDYKPKSFNVTNVLSRHEESYHQGIKDMGHASDHGQEESPKSIHDIKKVKDPRIAEKIVFDAHPRYSFIEHFMPADTDIAKFLKNSQEELLTPVLAPYEIENLSFLNGRKYYTARFTRTATLATKDRLLISKMYMINNSSPAFEVEYQLKNLGENEIRMLFGVELNLTLLAGNDASRYFTTKEGIKEIEHKNLSSLIQHKPLKSLSLVDEWAKFRMTIEQGEPSEVWIMPLETVSQSESGFELTYQGSTVVLVNQMKLAPASSKVYKISFSIEEL